MSIPFDSIPNKDLKPIPIYPILFDGWFYIFIHPITGIEKSYSTYKNAKLAYDKIKLERDIP